MEGVPLDVDQLDLALL